MYTVSPSGYEQANIMIDVEKVAKTIDAKITCHATYSSPRLKVFGPVGTLTQAGGTGSKEGSMAAKPNML
jgi:hypothetical protein